MEYISHPLVKPETIEKREYQLSIAMKALDANTMVILPTGLGKTAVALTGPDAGSPRKVQNKLPVHIPVGASQGLGEVNGLRISCRILSEAWVSS